MPYGFQWNDVRIVLTSVHVITDGHKSSGSVLFTNESQFCIDIERWVGESMATAL